MKRLVALVALGVVVATSAFAQSAPHSRSYADPAYQYGQQRVHPYDADHYQRWYGDNNANPDFQLGGSER
jgi:hypothetical protein